jgi:sugar lactone lactonase YvrE
MPRRYPAATARTRRSLLAAAALLAVAACDGPAGEPAPGDAQPATTAAGDASVTAAVSGTPQPAGPTEAPTSPAAAVATERALASLPRFARQFGRQGTSDGALQLPFCLAMDAQGLVYIGDTTGLQAFDSDGTFVRRYGAGDLAGVVGVAVSPDGQTVYAADQTGRLVALGPEGEVVRTLSAPDSGPLAGPNALALASDGALYVADAQGGQVVVLGPDGAVRQRIGEAGQGRGQFTSPRALALDEEGMLYVGLGDDYLVQRFDPSGAYVDAIGHTYADETIFRVGGIAFDASGRMYTTRSATHYLSVYDVADPSGRWIGDLGRVGSGPGEFNTPTGIAVFGEQLFVADQDNHRVQVFDLPPPEGDGD